MKLLLIDHAFHKHTGSSRFFIELLSPHFEVEHIYVDTEFPDSSPVFAAPVDHDIVVLWQLDYLAPYFIGLGKRTVVVPMYDGSANMPPLHWQASSEARFVNFSRTLHDRVCSAGASSLLVRYFPEAVSEDRLPTFDGLRVFLWQRRPEDIDVAKVDSMLGQHLESLHVHNAPDSSTGSRTLPAIPAGRLYARTESRWFESRTEYWALLSRCNMYIAPRVAEGIGFAFLEAMARGMLVVASDEPTHSEYIDNWSNGILFNHQAAGPFSLNAPTAARIARMGWKGVQIGRERWLRSLPELIDWIATTPAPKTPVRRGAGFLASLCSAYLAGGTAYTAFLARHAIAPPTPQKASSAAEAEVLPGQCIDDLPDGLVFGTGAPAVDGLVGFSAVDAYSAAVGGSQAGFEFRLGRGLAGGELSIEGRKQATADLVLTVALNGQAPVVKTLDDAPGPLKVRLLLETMTYGQCTVRLRCVQRSTFSDERLDGRVTFGRIRLLRSDVAAAPRDLDSPAHVESE